SRSPDKVVPGFLSSGILSPFVIVIRSKMWRARSWPDSIEYRWAGDGTVLSDHVAELLAIAPDLILTNSTPVTVALREQSGTVPIVFTQVVDPVGQGLVPNLARPGGNVTGFTSFEFSIGTKWLEALKQTAVRVTRVALVFNPQSAPYADLFLRPVEAAAPS